MNQAFLNLKDAFKQKQLPVLRYGLQQGDNPPAFVTIEGQLEDRQNIYSVSKAFTASAIGMAEAERKLSLEDPLIRFFPEHADGTSDEHKTITIKHLLQMQSGKKVPLFHRQKQDTKKNYAELFFKEPLQTKPGTEFYYCNLNSYMLGLVIEKCYHVNLRDFLAARLFNPLGFDAVFWATCPAGHPLGYSGLELSCPELMTFGKVLMNHGQYEDQQLIPRTFVKRMATDLVPSKLFPEAETQNGYGYQVWRCSYPGSWRADGLYGQFILLYPEQELIFTCLTKEDDHHQAYDIIDLVNSLLLPHVTD